MKRKILQRSLASGPLWKITFQARSAGSIIDNYASALFVGRELRRDLAVEIEIICPHSETTTLTMNLRNKRKSKEEPLCCYSATGYEALVSCNLIFCNAKRCRLRLRSGLWCHILAIPSRKANRIAGCNANPSTLHSMANWY